MEKIKIIEGIKEIYGKEANKSLGEGWLPVIETYRVIEYCGKIYYTCIYVKGENN